MQMPYPAKVESIHFASGTAQIVGVLYAAQDHDPNAPDHHPAAILLHGMPGSEKNFDLAYRLRDVGWHVLIVHFRGSWGSGGDYDMTAQPDDALAAVNYLLAAVPTIDPARIALVGYSLGSRAAIVAAQRDKRIGAVVSIAGSADYDDLMPSTEVFTHLLPFLHNATVRSLSAQWLRLGGSENPVAIVGQLDRPLLIVHGTEDEIVPYFMAPALSQAAGQHATLITLEGADHTFTQHRSQLVEAVTGWLISWADSAGTNNC